MFDSNEITQVINYSIQSTGSVATQVLSSTYKFKPCCYLNGVNDGAVIAIVYCWTPLSFNSSKITKQAKLSIKMFA